MAFAQYVRERLHPIEWLWIDTCCINKESAAELSEAINLMFDWYHQADLWLVYLGDVDATHDWKQLRESVWFQRGWTLQELVAPPVVLFVTAEWQVIGHKGSHNGGSCRPHTGPDLGDISAAITEIPVEVIRDYEASRSFGVAEKLKWIDARTTLRQEDMSYVMYGILGVTLGANYGERYEGARQRLLAAIHQRETESIQQAELFRKIVDWISPPDPWTNHESARHRHEPHTGTWLLETDQYVAWEHDATQYLWLYGKAGCGKTILSSTAVEDTRTHCQGPAKRGHAFFYFTFTDGQKQTYKGLLSSLVSQLGWKEPGSSMLRRAF